MTLRSPLITLSALCLLLTYVMLSNSMAQDESADSEVASLRQEGSLVDFVRDVKPIFDAKCVSCHGPEDAKNDFRIDTSESIFDYVDAGDLESSLWVDYLITDDPDMRMPPPDSGDVTPLTGSELATIRLWIEEGAEWVDATDDVATEVETAESLPQTDFGKWWRFQGLFHPASVHFPIALLAVSAGFVFLSFFSKTAFEPVAFHCLWIGALGAIVSCVMGWSYAVYEGYGSGFSFDLQGSAIDRHRWLGIVVAVLACILVPLARSVRRTGDTGVRLMWLVGSLCVVGGVSLAGYQGGELTYGEDHYWQEYERLFPANDAAEDQIEQADADDETELDSTGESTAESEGESDTDADTDAGGDAEPSQADDSEDNGDGNAVDRESDESSATSSGSTSADDVAKGSAEDGTAAEDDPADKADADPKAEDDADSADENSNTAQPTAKQPESETTTEGGTEPSQEEPEEGTQGEEPARESEPSATGEESSRGEDEPANGVAEDDPKSLPAVENP